MPISRIYGQIDWSEILLNVGRTGDHGMNSLGAQAAILPAEQPHSMAVAGELNNACLWEHQT